MNIKTEIKLENGKIEIITKTEHQFSETEKKILKILALNGYYEIKSVNEPIEQKEEYKAVQTLQELGLVQENVDAWHYTVNVVSTEEVENIFLQIIKKGV